MSGAGARRRGRSSERQAERWLKRQGLQTLARNYQCRSGEIDLVMQAPGSLVVVEVRFRGAAARVSAAESVTLKKQQRLARTALHFLQHHPGLASQPVRFDVLCVSASRRDYSFDWIRDAFRPAL